MFTGEDEDAILGHVAEHARADHGITEVSPELVESVRANISAVN